MPGYPELLAAIACLPLFSLVGCGFGIAGPELGADANAMRGTIYGGQQPVVGATVSVWEVGSSGYGAGATRKAQTFTDANGRFSFSASAYTCTASNTPMYIVATGGNPGAGTNANLAMLALLPACAAGKTTTVNINEVTTAAAIFAAGQFFNKTYGSGVDPLIGGTCTGCATGTYNAGLVAAFSNTYPMLVDNGSGSALASGSANGVNITRESAKLNTVGNILASCVNSTGSTSTTETTTTCGKLFDYTNAKAASPRPATTIQAALSIALYPWNNVSNLFALSSATSPFTGLGSVPNDYTLAISYGNATMGLAISGNTTFHTSSNIDIDNQGRVWFPTNSAAAHGIGFFDPASGTINGPYSTSLQKPQYLNIDQTGNILATDTASAAVVRNSTTLPTAGGTAISVPNLTNSGPILIDYDNVAVFACNLGGSTTSSRCLLQPALSAVTQSQVYFTGTPTALVFGDNQRRTASASGGNSCRLEYDSGTDIATNTGNCSTGGMIVFDTSSTNSLGAASTPNLLLDDSGAMSFVPNVPISQPEGLALDGAGQVWIANSGNASVSVLGHTADGNYPQVSPVAYRHGSPNGNTLTTPYGLSIDGSGNVWVSNASCVTTTGIPCTASGFLLTEIVGAAAPSITPYSTQTKNFSWGTLPTK